MKIQNIKINNIKIKKNRYIFFLLIFLLVFLFVLFVLFKYYNQNRFETKEHYLTFFVPFNQQYDEYSDLYNFYSTKTNNSFYFKSKMDYFKLKIMIIK